MNTISKNVTKNPNSKSGKMPLRNINGSNSYKSKPETARQNPTKSAKEAEIVPLSPESKTQFRLIGTPNLFRILRRLSTHIPSHITKLHLKYVEITPVLLTLIAKCENLEVINLENVKLKQAPQFKQRIILPELKQFTFHIKHEISDGIQWNHYVNSLNLKNLLFFDLKPNQDWSIDDLYDMGVEISFKINNVTLIHISHEDDELILNKTRAIRFSTDPDTKNKDIYSLSIAHCGISNPSELPFKSLAKLALFNVIIDSRSLYHHLQKCRNLTDLSIWNNGNVAYDPLDISKYLTSPKLKRISLYNFSLTFSPPPVSKTLVPFKNVCEFSLYSCKWDSLFIQYFCKAYPELGKLNLCNCSSSALQLLSKVFCTKDNNADIDLGIMHRSPLYSVSVRLNWEFESETIRADCLEKIRDYFTVIPSDFFQSNSTFLLQRPEVELNGNMKWTGKPISDQDVEGDRLFVLFRQFNLSKFWNDIHTYQKY